MHVRERWQALCQRLGGDADAAAWFTILESLHATPPRAYHNLDHVAECLGTLDSVRANLENADRVEFALWFHDCIYIPGRSDNEERSAQIAKACARALGHSAAWSTEATSLIMFTRHATPPDTNDAKWIVDIDMSILATPAERYQKYAAAIRSEFGYVPDTQFNAGRAAFIKGLLSRPVIYHTAHMRAIQEAGARANLTAELKGLESSA
jgi:predicted metal-dependent HD superfamily phosphohydrolase